MITKAITEKQIYDGLDAKLFGIYGFYVRHKTSLRALKRRASTILSAAQALKGIEEKDLHHRILDVRQSFQLGKRKGQRPIVQGMACLVEVVERMLGFRPHKVQIMGALAMSDGFLAEMATGEGKTVTAALAAAFSAWSGMRCHIITANDYLVARDAKTMSAIYDFAGLETGYIQAEMSPDERRIQYRKDIVYATSKEVLADFLRDRLKYTGQNFFSLQSKNTSNPVLPPLGMAIIDEADSILIDEAVTPLIISAPKENIMLKNAVLKANVITAKLESGIHYKVNLKRGEIELTSKGWEYIDDYAADLPGIWRSKERREELLLLTIKAREIFKRDSQYIISEGKIVIVDEFTGRPMPQRSWSMGLHQAIEAKEGVELSDPAETMARLSFQRFFRFYPRLAGMTGTAKEAAGEFWHIYHLPVVSIPTNLPCKRKYFRDRVFLNENKKWDTVVSETLRISRSGRPVLVGTRSVRDSEKLAERLEAQGVSFFLLNAVHHEQEAGIVAQGGEGGRITIATNMAGRGTDIKLALGISEMGGMHVIATERHKSRRIDRQLFGRCARKGEPGSCIAIISLEDEILKRFLPNFLRKLFLTVWSLLPLSIFAGGAVRLAQKTAENMAFAQRKQVLKSDTWLTEALSFADREL